MLVQPSLGASHCPVQGSPVTCRSRGHAGLPGKVLWAGLRPRVPRMRMLES